MVRKMKNRMDSSTKTTDIYSNLIDIQVDETELRVEDSVFIPENQSLIRKYTKHFTKWVLFMFDIDPHCIYKGTHHNSHLAKYRQYSLKELRIDPSNDKLPRNLKIIKRVILIHLLIKYLINCFVQMMKYKISEDHKSKNLNVDYKQNQAYRFFDSLGNLFGNPLSELTGVSLMVYSALIVGFVYAIGYLPYYFSYNPADAVNLRFLLDPQREIKRIDILIRNKLDEYAMFINSRKFPLKENYLNRYDRRNSIYRPICFKSVHYTNQTKDNLTSLDRQMNVLNHERSRIWKMRPASYDWERYKELHMNIFIFQIAGWTIGITLLCHIPQLIISAATVGKCQIMYSRENCTFSEVFNWRDILAFIELSIGVYCFGILIVFDIITIISNTICQLESARSIREDLSKYLNDIRTFNRKNGEKNSISYSNSELIALNEALDKFGEQLMAEMLLYLIKTTLSEVDLKSNAIYITQIVESFLITFAMGILSSLLSSRLNGLDIRIFRMGVFMATIAGANLILATSAFVYAKITDNEKIGWSILAQNSIRSSFESKEYGSSENDVFTTGWRKLILSRGLSDERNAISVFGMKITFKRVLELNFLVISLISLIR